MADDQKVIKLDFGGVFMKPSGLPVEAGIYCVYACTDKDEKTVTNLKLLYIGESGKSVGIQQRVSTHEKAEEWKKQLPAGQVLCFTAAKVSDRASRERAEAAMIFHHKPPVNDEYTHSFPFDTTTINVTGKTSQLTPSFTVKKEAKD